jgi:hypothetical protein
MPGLRVSCTPWCTPRFAPGGRRSATPRRSFAAVNWIILGVTVATLLVALYEVRILKGRFQREDEAELRVEEVRLNENPRVPSGWQAFATLRNVGGATAYNPEIWEGRPDPAEVRQRSIGRNETLMAGQSHTLGRDLRAVPDGMATIWLTWDDARGTQIRDSGESVGHRGDRETLGVMRP